MAGTPAKFEYVSMLARNEGKLFPILPKLLCVKNGRLRIQIVYCALYHQSSMGGPSDRLIILSISNAPVNESGSFCALRCGTTIFGRGTGRFGFVNKWGVWNQQAGGGGTT